VLVVVKDSVKITTVLVNVIGAVIVGVLLNDATGEETVKEVNDVALVITRIVPEL